ncbi:hypothetical protein [Desulfovibrio cuneatus]|uniref:hypothetical protein n=1 Tax=Desulfovibrio cuneatus TaxID=159728 RepID=UPI0004214AA5|nr:hypothetical protein [Desulfovibrio cuneatus]
MNWIEIFRTGTHTDSAGTSRTFTGVHLDHMVASFNPARHEPPLVLGHPKTDGPAYGWVQAMKREGERLLAGFRNVPPALQTAVDDGHYQKRSIALFADGRLRHVGLLGAAVPAVEGLANFTTFTQNGTEPFACIEFSLNETAPTQEEPMNTPPANLEDKVKQLEAENALLKAKSEGASAERIAALEQELAAANTARTKAETEKTEAQQAFAAAQQQAQQHTLQTKVNALVQAGQVLPQDTAKVLAFAAALPQGTEGELEFSEGAGKKPLVTHFLEFLGTLPGHNLQGEFAAPGNSQQSAPGTLPPDLTMKV